MRVTAFRRGGTPPPTVAPASRDGDDGLPGRTGLGAERVRRLGERADAPHQGPQPALPVTVDDLREMTPVGLDDEVHRPAVIRPRGPCSAAHFPARGDIKNSIIVTGSRLAPAARAL